MDIDLSNNLQVEELFIAGNKMTTLIISDLPKLKVLDPIPNENLKNLTISNNSELEEIRLNLSFGQKQEFDELTIINNAGLHEITTDQINAIRFDCSNNPFSTINFLPFTNMKTLKFTGELIKYQGSNGFVLPKGVESINVENNDITGILFQD